MTTHIATATFTAAQVQDWDEAAKRGRRTGRIRQGIGERFSHFGETQDRVQRHPSKDWSRERQRGCLSRSHCFPPGRGVRHSDQSLLRAAELEQPGFLDGPADRGHGRLSVFKEIEVRMERKRVALQDQQARPSLESGVRERDPLPAFRRDEHARRDHVEPPVLQARDQRAELGESRQEQSPTRPERLGPRAGAVGASWGFSRRGHSGSPAVLPVTHHSSRSAGGAPRQPCERHPARSPVQTVAGRMCLPRESVKRAPGRLIIASGIME